MHSEAVSHFKYLNMFALAVVNLLADLNFPGISKLLKFHLQDLHQYNEWKPLSRARSAIEFGEGEFPRCL